MELNIIPTVDEAGQEQFIIYRPLLGLAFVGNQSMVALATAVSQSTPTLPQTPHQQALAFLADIGFLSPDPPPPALPPDAFRPTTAVLLMTNQCQLRCVYCYAAAGELPKEELSPELGCAAIAYVSRTAQELHLSRFELSFHGGGEPTFAWHTLQTCVRYARSQPLPAKLTLTSNGVWSPHQREYILDHFDGLSLSVDGTPETQNQQRPFLSGHGSARTLLKTIAALDARHFPYGIRMTATAPWSHFPEDVRFLCQHTSCSHIQVEPAFHLVRGGHEGGSQDECRVFAQAFLEAHEIATQAGRQLHYAGARIGLVTTTFCQAPYNALIVNPRGELVTCYEVTDTAHPLACLSRIGRIVEGQVSIETAAQTHLHQHMAERRQSCQDCFCYWTCAGDCYTRTFRNTPQGHLIHGPRCTMNQTITQGLLLDQIARAGGVWHRGGSFG